MTDVDTEALRKGLAYGAIAFGALATLTPRLFAGVYGLDGDGNLRAMIRLWGTRTALLGALGLAVTDRDQKRMLVTSVTAMNVADSLITLKAGPDVKLRSRLLGAASSAGFAAAGAYWLSETK